MSGRTTIDQLLALNEEIAALARAGAPMGRGLLAAGRDVRGRLGRIAGALGARLERGEGLVEALRAEGESVPPLYRAVVEAGASAGRLPAALEGMARYVRAYREARTAIGLALWYPVVVLCVAYVLFLGMTVLIVPRFIDAFQSLGLSVAAPLYWLDAIGGAARFWSPIGPVLLTALLIAWLWSGTTAGLRRRGGRVLRLVPWMRRLLNDYEAAGIAELLALLLEHQTPFSRAIVMAAEAGGNSRTIAEARVAAEALERGEPPASAFSARPKGRSAFPPMLRWALASGGAQGDLAGTLRRLAEQYRKRARFQAEKLQWLLPSLLIVGVGAVAVLFYGLALFVPLTAMLRELAHP